MTASFRACHAAATDAAYVFAQMKRKRIGPTNSIFILVGGMAALAAGCPNSDGERSGAVNVDGSSTMYPISQAVAEEFRAETGERATVGVSGSGGGFTRLCRGEVHVSAASRPIKPSEREACAEADIDFIEAPIAYDGLAVLVHPDNDWVESMTVRELKKVWEPAAQGEITRWNQIRPEWPDRRLNLYAPSVDNGTYDYFTHAVVGRESASRGDYTSSADQNVLVQGVSGDPNALGFFGYAYYAGNAERLKLVAIDDEDPGTHDGPVRPSADTIQDGTYQPLTRPLFIYANREALDEETVEDFVEFYIGESAPLVEEVGYVPLPASTTELALERFAERATGSVFEGGSQIGVSAEQLLKGS